MNKKKTELIYLRAFICILIIVTHLLTQMMNDIDDTEINQLKLLYYVQNIVIFGTPSFIILSQLLTTLNYEKITFKYLWSRFKYIFIPYLTIGLFYCYTESLKLNSPFLHQFYENIVLGYWYGYFIIVILQYFILFYNTFMPEDCQIKNTPNNVNKQGKGRDVAVHASKVSQQNVSC